MVDNGRSTTCSRSLAATGARSRTPIAPDAIIELVGLIQDGPRSSSPQVSDVSGRAGLARAIVGARGAGTDTGPLEAAAHKIIAANPDKAEAVKAKPQAIGWFVGQIMKETGGKANPAAVNEILKRKLGV